MVERIGDLMLHKDLKWNLKLQGGAFMLSVSARPTRLAEMLQNLNLWPSESETGRFIQD